MPASPFHLSALASFFLLSLLPTEAAAQVQALFIFGDSVVDCGNNDYLPGSTATADFLPYGIDLPAVTGRYTNARTVADILGELLGIEHFVACSRDPNTKGQRILNGVNYASAGTGILEWTGRGEIITPLPDQVLHFEEKTLPDLESQLGKNLPSFLSKSLFLFNTGGNDYISNCFGEYECDIPTFTEFLVTNYTTILKGMYNLGARNFVLFSAEVSGCTPFGRSSNDGICNEDYNYASTTFNTRLNASIDELNQEMADAHFIFVSLYQMITEIIEDPSAYGFDNITAPCCKVPDGATICEEAGAVCPDRSKYLYFDGGHPTDAANIILANRAFYSNQTTMAYPFNVKQLMNVTSLRDDTRKATKPWSMPTNFKDVQ
ncbi:GDSL esterase/lipase At4g16230-like [Nymphaea colorata]|nr:GDSL esterase/lipase At4g16230-like [Nymphaea colorata]